ncbi:hypothetical protein F3J34_26175 [Klebsiella sp. Ap-873]|nr:hypothetical protein [Klebsiella sp. Ap-873]
MNKEAFTSAWGLFFGLFLFGLFVANIHDNAAADEIPFTSGSVLSAATEHVNVSAGIKLCPSPRPSPQRGEGENKLRGTWFIPPPF